MAIFFNFSPTSSHLHSLQVENCDSNSRLVVDEDDNGKFRLERVKYGTYTGNACRNLCIVRTEHCPVDFYSLTLTLHVCRFRE